MCVRVQDVTHKVVEAIGTIAGSSLEQTTWLRRNLEVKASPQIMVDGTSLEQDVEGRSNERTLAVCASCVQYVSFMFIGAPNSYWTSPG